MSSDPEIDTIVAAMVKTNGDAQAETYRSLAIRFRDEFNAKELELDEQVSQAEILMGAAGNDSGSRRAGLDHVNAAYELATTMTPLAAKLAVGGNKAYQEKLEGYTTRLDQLSKRSSAGSSGSGCLGVLLVFFLAAGHRWFVS